MRESCPEVCPVKEGVDSVHTYVCLLKGREDPSSVSGWAINLSIRVP